MLFLLALEWNLWEKAFSCVQTKPNSNFAVKGDELLFSNNYALKKNTLEFFNKQLVYKQLYSIL